MGNAFVEELLPELSGDAVKLYLVLRYNFSEGLDFFDEAARKMMGVQAENYRNALEELVTAGVLYWDEAGTLVLVADSRLKEAKNNALGREFLRRLQSPGGDALRDAYNEVEAQINTKFFNGRMTGAWHEIIDKFKKVYKFSPEAILLLFTQCQPKNQGNASYQNYVKKVAESWHNAGIVTEDDVERYEREHGDNLKYISYVRAKLAFQRNFTEAECSTIISWRTAGITQEMLGIMLDDTNKVAPFTIAKIDTNVKKWLDAGLKTPEDVKNFLAAEKEARKATQQKTTSGQGTGRQQGGQVHFESERNYNEEYYNDILAKKAAKKKENG